VLSRNTIGNPIPAVVSCQSHSKPIVFFIYNIITIIIIVV
jgi:hypothetical protein